MAFIPSLQQKNLFTWITEGFGSCVLEAVAGSGKTTTLVEALKLMIGTIFFGAYNKKIAEEIKLKAGAKEGLNISTFHAAGLGMWKKVAPKCTIDANKCANIYKETFTGDIAIEIKTVVLNLVSYAKQAAVGAVCSASDDSVWYNLINHFNVDCLGYDAEVVETAKEILKLSVALDTKVVDFDDMIYCPLVHKVKPTEYDWVLIDEAQDTNASRRALALLMLKEGGRLIAVGDRHQAIYGFTGADADALDLIAKAVNAVQMPLTVTYRCPKSVVKEAQKYVGHITAHESAIEGSVTNFTGDLIKSVKVGDAILCRFNAPIIELVYKFIAEGIPAKVEGREVGTSMKTLAKRYKVKSYAVLVDKLTAYCDRESAKLRIKERESQAVAIQDKVKCLKVIINRVQQIDPRNSDPVWRVCQEIDTIFADGVDTKSVLLSTIHKSKGREWKNVYFLQTGASKWARMDWEMEQEKNLLYVAITRSQENLFMIPVPEKDSKEER